MWLGPARDPWTTRVTLTSDDAYVMSVCADTNETVFSFALRREDKRGVLSVFRPGQRDHAVTVPDGYHPNGACFARGRRVVVVQDARAGAADDLAEFDDDARTWSHRPAPWP